MGQDSAGGYSCYSKETGEEVRKLIRIKLIEEIRKVAYNSIKSVIYTLYTLQYLKTEL